MPDLKAKLLAVSEAWLAAGKLLALIGESNDPYAFLYYCKQGEVERALDTIERPNEEIHQDISKIRGLGEDAADEVPEIKDTDRRDFLQH